MDTIILNPQEALLLDYEQNFQHLTSYEGYLSIFVQASNNIGE